MIEMLEKGELEVAIVGVPGELPESLHQLPIFEERFVIVLPPNHRLVAQRSGPRRRARQGALRQPLELRGVRAGSRGAQRPRACSFARYSARRATIGSRA